MYGLYALKVLKSHGLKNENQWGVTKATLVNKLLYASQVEFGLPITDSETGIWPMKLMLSISCCSYKRYVLCIAS